MSQNTEELHSVYVYINTSNGVMYVGRTKDLKKRNRDHQSLARKGKGWSFHQAIRDHGIEAFCRVVPFTGSAQEALTYEAGLIAEYKLQGAALYNETEGGHDIKEVRIRGLNKIVENKKRAREVA